MAVMLARTGMDATRSAAASASSAKPLPAGNRLAHNRSPGWFARLQAPGCYLGPSKIVTTNALTTEATRTAEVHNELSP